VTAQVSVIAHCQAFAHAAPQSSRKTFFWHDDKLHTTHGFMQASSDFSAAMAVLASALGCGLLMGIERERRKGDGPFRSLAGVRSLRWPRSAARRQR
jgi:hypothetical protein